MSWQRQNFRKKRDYRSARDEDRPKKKIVIFKRIIDHEMAQDTDRFSPVKLVKVN